MSGAIKQSSFKNRLGNDRAAKEPMPVNEQQRTQISSGHRLIRLARQKRYQLYSQEEFQSKAISIPADYWLTHFTSALKSRMNEAMAQRINAAILRARSNAHLFDVKKAGIAEYVTEAFFDNWWFKPKSDHLPRIILRDQVSTLLDKGCPLQLYFPIMSRKPFSPLKNRGVQPDLAELYTLVRCAEATQVINALSPTGCQLNILADGFKYNRACQTPDEAITAYQTGLAFWVNYLGISDIINIVDYERWVRDGVPASLLDERCYRYDSYCHMLYEKYESFFDVIDLEKSLRTIEHLDDIGRQIHYTFWSIVSSTYYPELYAFSGNTTFFERHYGDDVQNLYSSYLSSLHRPLHECCQSGENLPRFGYLPPGKRQELFHTMRQRAWRAALRYVAISLTDRELQPLHLIAPDAIKLTIHAKKGELHFLCATQQDANMTAQHCTGGLSLHHSSVKATFRYRLERESNGELPILLEPLPLTEFNQQRYGPLLAMQNNNQPVGYTTVPRLILEGRAHSFLTRKG